MKMILIILFLLIMFAGLMALIIFIFSVAAFICNQLSKDEEHKDYD